MHRRLAVTAIVAGALFAAAPATSLATPTGNHGQPNQDCESLGVGPAGFQTTGFQHATDVYAGAGTSATQSRSGNAVSQYDVACFQMAAR